MKAPKWVLQTLLAALFLGFPLMVLAQSEGDAKLTGDVSQLDRLNKELEQLKAEEGRLLNTKMDVSREIQQAPDLANQLREEIRRIEKNQQQSKVPHSTDALESAIQLLDAQAKALQQGLSYVMERIGEQQSLPSVAREKVIAAQKQAQDVESKLQAASIVEKGSVLDSLSVTVLKQQLQNIDLRKQVTQQKLDGYQKLLALYTVNRDLLLLQLGMIKNTLVLLREKRDEQRKETADIQQEKAALLQQNFSDQPKLLLAQLKENQSLTEYFVSITNDLNKVTDRVADGKQELQEIRYRFEVAKQQLELTGLYQYVDDYLLRQRQSLQIKIKEHESLSSLGADISKIRLDQFKFDDQLHNVRTATARNKLLSTLLQEQSLDRGDIPEDVLKGLIDAFEQREMLLSQLVSVNADYVVALTNLELVYQDQFVARQQFYELLNKKLFWRRSAKSLDLEWFGLLPESVAWFLSLERWKQVATSWRAYWVSVWVPVFGVAVLLVLSVWFRPRILHRLKRINDHIGKVTKDKFRYTFEVLILTFVLSLPAPLFVAFLSLPLLHHQLPLLVESVGVTSLVLARWLLVFEFVRQLIRPDGLAQKHFLWRPVTLAVMRQWLPMLYCQLPIAFVFIVIWREGNDFHSGILGRAGFIATVALLLLYTAKIFNPHQGITQILASDKKRYWFQRWNRAVFFVMTAIPAALLLMAIYGFTFTAMEVMLLSYQTAMFGLLVFVADQVLHRWFSVMERKLAYSRALAKRDALRKAKEQQQAAKDSGEGVIDLDMPSLDVATISEQNRALLRVMSFSVFAFFVVFTWQDIFQAIDTFREISLWTYQVGEGNAAQMQTVTLATFLYTLFGLLITFAGVKNLPGLIEVMILQRFNIDSGIRFAITTTARYLVMIAGIMLISGMIGLDWSKLGWLVAALGVGLGFGLQEIFANFVSGLIILYERPIRIGDTVTINDLSGTVSRIRMRATTITDWDQKELIIPNKTFVTNQFINWTLSDTTTRMVVKVGVAYGSDTELVAKTLLEIAKEHTGVMKVPAPSAFFLGFGASSLDFELRVFVDSFVKRLPILHELHTRIDARFKALGLEIAFPQLDLHVKHLPKPD